MLTRRKSNVFIRNSSVKYVVLLIGERGGGGRKRAAFKKMLLSFDWSISTAALVSKWHYFATAEWVLKVGCIKPVNVLRYSDAVVLISQLSKSCSCGIKTDTVPVSDLGGGRERGEKMR